MSWRGENKALIDSLAGGLVVWLFVVSAVAAVVFAIVKLTQ